VQQRARIVGIEMRTWLCSGAVTAGVLLAAHGSVADVSVIGVRSCEAWQEAQTGDSELTPIGRTWINGFLSGMAVGSHKDFWSDRSGRLLNHDAIYVWITDYCRANPSKDVADAAVQLFLQRTAPAR
jgi:hypothetical protein